MRTWKKLCIITIILAIAVLISFAWMYFKGAPRQNNDNIDVGDVQEISGEGYQETLFGDGIQHINIIVSNRDWRKMIKNKEEKQYIACDLEINGQKFSNVGIRPKGQSTLTRINNDRIALKVDMAHYVDNQTCYGLTDFVLNNSFADATYMKDYIAYDLMQYEGVKAPLHTFAYLTLNGKPFGVYLMAEQYKKDYLERVFGNTSIRLYNVKKRGLNPYESADLDAVEAAVISSRGLRNPDEIEDGPTLGQGGELCYDGKSTEHYTAIFANAVFKDTTAEDYARVLRAIKYLNKENVTKEELEQYWDIDEILRYLAVHTFMVNDDGYGGTAQNYYIAEKDGRITILPWDYNLSFGGRERRMSETGSQPKRYAADAKEIINSAIDTPLAPGIEMEQRPLISVLLSFDEYKTKYHSYLSELTDYVSGEFIEKLNVVENNIYPYIEQEKTTFYSSKAHKKGFDVLQQFLKLRCESIKGQLDGSIASVTSKQTGDTLVKSDISIQDMGYMTILSNNTKRK